MEVRRKEREEKDLCFFCKKRKAAIFIESPKGTIPLCHKCEEYEIPHHFENWAQMWGARG